MKSIRFPAPVADDTIRAIQADRKTATRRVVKLKYNNTHLEMKTNKYGTRLIELQNEEPGVTIVKNPDGTTTRRLLAYIEKTPPYHPGDILYVQEPSWKWPGGYEYKADYDDNPGYIWTPSIHMPREAARIFLRVTDVRVERLQDMPDEDLVRDFGFCREAIQAVGRDALAKPLWDSTIKPADRAIYGWDANPWVWVIKFEQISREEAEGHA